MAKINLEGQIPGRENAPSAYTINGAEEMSIEELVESIREKIQLIRTKKARNSRFRSPKAN
ncbi:MAG TPA: hypothetical protein VK112_12645 [Fodinibius sp.]|nr:hypothetical protein [Fodinibius sp.]